MNSSVVAVVGEELVPSFLSISIQDQVQTKEDMQQVRSGVYGGDCAICWKKIVLEETALIKGCEHAYWFVCNPLQPVGKPLPDVTCILRWASYSQKQACKCPQCKNPFEFLNVHRTLDGRIQDYMFEESVCLLLRASWFNPMTVKDNEEAEDYSQYENEEDELEEDYLDRPSSNLRIGNRRWGDSGYVRTARQVARPACRQNTQNSGAISSHEPKRKDDVNDKMGRRAKRALKREAADKAAAAKHVEHLARLGRQ